MGGSFSVCGLLGAACLLCSVGLPGNQEKPTAAVDDVASTCIQPYKQLTYMQGEIVQQVKALENPRVPRHGEPVPYVPPTPWSVRRAIEEGPRAVREMRPYTIPRRA